MQRSTLPKTTKQPDGTTIFYFPLERLIKVTLFCINCLRKTFLHFSFYLLTFLSWIFLMKKFFGCIKKSAKKLPLNGMVFLTLISIINSVCIYAPGISRWEAQKSITETS